MIKKILLTISLVKFSLAIPNIQIIDLGEENAKLIDKIAYHIAYNKNIDLEFNDQNYSHDIIKHNSRYNIIFKISINRNLFDTYSNKEKEFIIARYIYSIFNKTNKNNTILSSIGTVFACQIFCHYFVFGPLMFASIGISELLKKYLDQDKVLGTGISLSAIVAIISWIKLSVHLLNQKHTVISLDNNVARILRSTQGAISVLEKDKKHIEELIKNGHENLQNDLKLIHERIYALKNLDIK